MKSIPGKGTLHERDNVKNLYENTLVYNQILVNGQKIIVSPSIYKSYKWNKVQRIMLSNAIKSKLMDD